MSYGFMNRGVTIAFLLCSFAVEPAISCSIDLIDHSADRVADAFAQATFVFLGEVESVETVTKRYTRADGRIISHAVQIARIKVLKPWKGDKKAGDMVVSHAEPGSAHGWRVRPREQWLLYVSNVEPTLSVFSRSPQPALNSADIPVIERILRGEPAREACEFSIEVPEPHIAFQVPWARSGTLPALDESDARVFPT
ncbi:MAG TPA: hypothetical protein VJS12_09585 [Steroidobacteraceae bacterium]|nr:hypothetical protein [Steroidobacteraceae bacterium]